MKASEKIVPQSSTTLGYFKPLLSTEATPVCLFIVCCILFTIFFFMLLTISFVLQFLCGLLLLITLGPKYRIRQGGISSQSQLQTSIWFKEKYSSFNNLKEHIQSVTFIILARISFLSYFCWHYVARELSLILEFCLVIAKPDKYGLKVISED